MMVIISILDRYENLPRGKTREEFGGNVFGSDFRPYVVERKITKGLDLELYLGCEQIWGGNVDGHEASPISPGNRSP